MPYGGKMKNIHELKLHEGMDATFEKLSEIVAMSHVIDKQKIIDDQQEIG